MEYETIDLLINHLPRFLQVFNSWLNLIPWPLVPFVLLAASMLIAIPLSSLVMWWLKTAFGYEEK